MTIQKKTALLFTGIMATILLGICILTYFFTNTFAFIDFYRHLELRAKFTATSKLDNNAQHIAAAYDDIRQLHFEMLPGEREFLYKADSIAYFKATAEGKKLPQSFYDEVVQHEWANYKRGNFFYKGLLYTSDKGKYIVIVGAENTEYTVYAENLRWILIICFFSGILIAYTSGIFFSRHTFKPVREIIDKVGTIQVENLHLRLEEARSDDEIAVLTTTFNKMLSRLETAFEAQNNFISNASHELRTPLTAIYGEAEIALSRPRTEEGYKATLEIILQQAEKLQHLTDSLLSLAQTGFDGKKVNFKRFRIAELLQDVHRTLNNLIPDNKVTFCFDNNTPAPEDTMISGNYDLLKLGISNVIVNACKYSNNNDVAVTLAVHKKQLQITTQDKGIGIPQQELKFIYDPFFRASNTGLYHGYGIGLPLTRNIFRLHNGSIHVTSADNSGTRVVLTLPVTG
ncbi:MAG: HAMP domain-containing sensor histidine kinase [Bacteroidota bacterium]